MNFKKHFLLLIIFDFFALFLVFQGSALAGCADQYYYTQCDNKVTIGNCCWGSEDGTCCGEYKKCEETCDEEGNCTETCKDVCNSWCRECRCNRNWYEYSCGSSANCICNNGDPQCCDGDIYRRKCYSKEEGDCSMGSCESESCHFDRCDSSELCEECQSWQKPVRAGCGNNCTKWGTADTKPECKCCGECIKAPTGLQEYQTPDSSMEAEKPAKLPVKLDWDDVPGFWSGGGGGGGGSAIQEYADCQRGFIDGCWEEAKTLNPGWSCQGQLTGDYLICLRRKTKENCEEKLQEDEACKKTCPALEEGGDECYDPNEFVKSYRIEIAGDLRSCDDGSDMNGDTVVLGVSEFFAPCSCYFKSNQAYTWKVQACCTADGNNCGPWSNTWTFTTSPAPEPISPYDPDWAGPGGAANLSIGEFEKLEWCEINDPQRYPKIIIVGEKWYSPRSDKLLIYYLNLEKNQYLCHPNLSTKEGECLPILLTPDMESKEAFLAQIHPFYFIDEDKMYFTESTSYAWKVAACEGFAGNNPTDYSQEWRFSVKEFSLPYPKVDSPQNNKDFLVGLPVSLKWTSPYAFSWNYIVKGGGKTFTGTTKIHNISFDYPDFITNTVYSWKIQPCWDYEAKDCEYSWGELPWWSFKTTGRPPNLISPAPDTVDVFIPIDFKWEDVPRAKSYIFKIQGTGLDLTTTTKEEKIFLDYPDLHQETEYSWQVKTCVHDNGEVCGDYSLTQKFKTIKIISPTNPNPGASSAISTTEQHKFSWDEIPGAKYYQFKIIYTEIAANETKEECSGLLGKEKTKIISENSIYYSLKCKGEYQWQVKGCLDENCEEVGDWNDPPWLLTLFSEELPPNEKGGFLKGGGLVPCGRNYNDPDTPWDETDSCEIKHIFILIKQIIDFLLWKVGPLLLVLLTVATGVIFYFSIKMGTPAPIAKVKSLWIAAGIGYGIVFFAWTIISFILTLFGYKVGLFGPWWRF